MLPLIISLPFVVSQIASTAIAFPSFSKTRSLAVPHTTSSSLFPSQLNTTSPNSAGWLKTFSLFPVHCFDPHTVPLERAIKEDCDHIVDNIILRLFSNPFDVHSWGFTDAADINLTEEPNDKWHYSECVVFVRTMDRYQIDWFRAIDVAHAVNRIIRRCITDTKYALGGTVDLDGRQDGFYVVAGGFSTSSAANDTASLPQSNKTVLSLSRNTERSVALVDDDSD